MYRLGIVYIMRDDSLSEVFNLRGIKYSLESGNIPGVLSNINDTTSSEVTVEYQKWYEREDEDKPIEERKINYIPKEDFILNGQHLNNTMGVFKLPADIQIFDHNNSKTHP